MVCRNPCVYVYRKYTTKNKHLQLRLQCKNCGRYTEPLKHFGKVENLEEIDHELHYWCKKTDPKNCAIRKVKGKFEDVKCEL